MGPDARYPLPAGPSSTPERVAEVAADLVGQHRRALVGDPPLHDRHRPRVDLGVPSTSLLLEERGAGLPALRAQRVDEASPI